MAEAGRERANGADAAPEPVRPLKPFFDEAKRVLETEFKIYESRVEASPLPGQEVAVFYVQVFDRAEFEAKIGRVTEKLRTIDERLVALVRREGGEDVILVARKPPQKRVGLGLAVVLYLLTVATTVWSGALAWVSYRDAAPGDQLRDVIVASFQPRFLLLGFLAFSLPLLLILTVHEAAHWFTAKRYRVHTTFPYFIPVPPLVFFPNIGTFGAVISMRDPMPNRKALFDIGASGPVAGFLVAILVVGAGLFMTSASAVPVPEPNEFHADLVTADGTTWGSGNRSEGLFAQKTNRARDKVTQTLTLNESLIEPQRGERWTLRLRSEHENPDSNWTARVTVWTGREEFKFRAVDEQGDFTETDLVELDAPVPANATRLEATFAFARGTSNTVELGEPLLFMAMAWLLDTPRDVIIHPVAFAGWVGLLATSINLLPAGQLDGGHVARAVLGDKMRWASYAAVLLLVGLSLQFFGWIYLVLLLLLFVGVNHPPPLDDVTELDTRRRVFAFVIFAVLVLSFIPVPLAL